MPYCHGNTDVLNSMLPWISCIQNPYTSQRCGVELIHLPNAHHTTRYYSIDSTHASFVRTFHKVVLIYRSILMSRFSLYRPPFSRMHSTSTIRWPTWWPSSASLSSIREAAHQASSISVKTQFATGSFNYEDLCQLCAVNSQHSNELLRHLVSSTVATHIEWY